MDDGVNQHQVREQYHIPIYIALCEVSNPNPQIKLLSSKVFYYYHHQMTTDDNKETHPAKKMKLQDKEIPKSQNGTNAVNFEDPQPTVKYSVLVEFKVVSQLRSTREDPLCLFTRMIKDIGCSETQISGYGCTSYCFLAELTPDEAKKLSDLDSIKEVKPYKSVPLDCIRQIYKNLDTPTQKSYCVYQRTLCT
ncbi:hypothetical protein POM88_048414 [Heracleum sosnowskyi]|uniref:Uncharacterized protein n=1 Tax=Heracleum sosnowskyi TaxID=360622 RepID=A0AAD8M0L0_9APIA|nr:hypothetical protein POM88_048414 [Heracleum sosnowskyi]